MTPTTTSGLAGSCPIPIPNASQILLAHGGGGRLMQQLIEQRIVPALGNSATDGRHDAAVFTWDSGRLAFTTDSFVVRPIFFPGGDLGSLAVHGTVNDLAMSGARPLYLSAAFILEEGFPLTTLDRVLQSMRAAADRAGVRIVTGDTKVVDRGKGDGLFINTAGIGIIEHGLDIGPASIQAGDAVLVSGDVGRHGMAVMAVREGLEFESAIESDSASVAGLVANLLAAGIRVRCLRDITRGGLTAVLNELARQGPACFQIRETAIPVRSDVRAACELLGLDPLQVACEGRFVAIVPTEEAERALQVMRASADDLGTHAALVGTVTRGEPGTVLLESTLGVPRVLDWPSGEPLPRIC